MKSAGNDIVALAVVDIQRTTSPNFYSKFVVPAERNLYEQPSIKKAVVFYHYVWLLWSVKEAAYKYTRRLQSGLIFSPSKYIVESVNVSNFLSGTVLFHDFRLFFRSWITDQYIHTIVNDTELFEGVYHEILKTDGSDSQNQSVAVRELAVKKLDAVLNAGGLTVSKSNEGYPVVKRNEEQLNIPLSFAHHDCFVGYSFKV